MKIRSCSMCLADWLTASGIEYGWIKLFQMKISVSFTSLPPTVKWKNRRRKPKPVGCHLSSCLQFHTMSIRSDDGRHQRNINRSWAAIVCNLGCWFCFAHGYLCVLLLCLLGLSANQSAMLFS